jgi:hypothetical protein
MSIRRAVVPVPPRAPPELVDCSQVRLLGQHAATFSSLTKRVEVHALP